MGDDTLSALEGRLEKATGGDRAIDAEIAVRFDGARYATPLYGDGFVSFGDGIAEPSPRYTASIDAALARYKEQSNG